MKILCLQGSPRQQGTTSKVLTWVEDALLQRGHAVEHVDIADKHLSGCLGCYTCQNGPGDTVCAVEDDALGIFRSMMDADAIVYATPLYCWGFPGTFKILIDRHLCLFSRQQAPGTRTSYLEGKRIALLVTCGGPEGKGNTDLISTLFRRLAHFGKSQVAAELIIPHSKDPSRLTEDHRAQATAFATQLTA